jgi:cysteinyl-tRNA synthetase
MKPTRLPMKSPPRPQDETPAKATDARLRLYNTLTRAKDNFAPIDPNAVRLYVCGPTVYDFAHIGNARPVIVFDVMFRLLRHLYGEDHVIYTRNITDVDDKINARAERDFPGLPLNEAIAKVTEATERQFHDDVSALGALPPTHEPRATQYIDRMRLMIERLIARGVAYVAEDHVLFSPSAMDSLPWAPRYGTLAHRSLDEMLAGARVDVAPYKRDAMDFVLWKPSKPNEPGWPSPRGIGALGRPGWHIECSAMSMATLLEPFGGGLLCDDPSRNTFDIHGGGIDLVFPHHENEIAQSCSAFHSSAMANFWMHNGFLQVEGEKMAKSAGNFVTIRELLEAKDVDGSRRWHGEAIRLAMLRTHYRQPINWTVAALEEARSDLNRWYRAIEDAEALDYVSEALIAALSDDLNTPKAIAVLHELAKPAIDARNAGGSNTFAAALLKASANVLGLLQQTRSQYRASLRVSGRVFKEEVTEGIAVSSASTFFLKADGTYTADDATLKRVDDLLARRDAARSARNFVEADKIRDQLAQIGVSVKDNKDGTTSWELKR